MDLRLLFLALTLFTFAAHTQHYQLQSYFAGPTFLDNFDFVRPFRKAVHSQADQRSILRGTRPMATSTTWTDRLPSSMA